MPETVDQPDVTASTPARRLAFEPVGSLEAAEAQTRRLTHGHYENFSVVTFLVPKSLRQDFCNVYAFCRTADDLGDDTANAEVALRDLGQFKQATLDCYAGRASSAVFTALQGTVRKHDIPIEPFLDLIGAFEQDQRVKRYETFDELLDYCRRSADPVGRLVLYLYGYRDEERQRLSDQTCTALQLANFWQDVRRDWLDLGRIYLPIESMRRFGLTEDDITNHIRSDSCDDRVRQLIRFEVDRTESLFRQGDSLLPLLNGRIRAQVGLFGAGGRAILQAIRQGGYDTLRRRPKLSRWQKSRLAMRAMLAVRPW